MFHRSTMTANVPSEMFHTSLSSCFSSWQRPPAREQTEQGQAAMFASNFCFAGREENLQWPSMSPVPLITAFSAGAEQGGDAVCIIHYFIL
jgi:hypothetical protein